MGPLSCMRSVVDRSVGMRSMTVTGNMVLASSSFHTRNNLSENNPLFGHAPSELFASHILGRKRISVWKGAWVLFCPGRPHVSGRPWLCGVDWYLCTDVLGQPKGNCSTVERWTDRLFHNSLTNYHQPTPHSVPEDRRLISNVYYQMHGSRSFLTTYEPFR